MTISDKIFLLKSVSIYKCDQFSSSKKVNKKYLFYKPFLRDPSLKLIRDCDD